MFVRGGAVARWVAALSLALLAGCGGGGGTVDGKYPLKGTVQFKGQPLAQGTIEIRSSDQALGTGAPIKDGQFEIEAANGLPPGTYVVRVSSLEGGAVATTDAPPGPEAAQVKAVETIPAEYNVRSTLSADVKADLESNQSLTFDLK